MVRYSNPVLVVVVIIVWAHVVVVVVVSGHLDVDISDDQLRCRCGAFWAPPRSTLRGLLQLVQSSSSRQLGCQRMSKKKQLFMEECRLSRLRAGSLGLEPKMAIVNEGGNSS